MMGIVIVFTAIHFLASLWHWPRNKTTMDMELVRQHHEKCTLLGLIALAVIVHS